MRVTLDAASFEDLEQETLVLAWSRRETCVDPARFDAWIYGIARRRILKHLERMQADRRRLIPFPALSPDAHPEVTPEPADTAFGRQVRENVAGCGTSVVAIAIAHAVDGQSFRAIAERLHQKETTVKNRYYRQLPEAPSTSRWLLESVDRPRRVMRRDRKPLSRLHLRQPAHETGRILAQRPEAGAPTSSRADAPPPPR